MTVHSGEKPYKCHVCDMVFSRSGHLTRHMAVHSGEKPYKCHMCDKVFSRSRHLTRHIHVHSGEKPYKCLLCDRSFSHYSTLQTHEYNTPHYYIHISTALEIMEILVLFYMCHFAVFLHLYLQNRR